GHGHSRADAANARGLPTMSIFPYKAASTTMPAQRLKLCRWLKLIHRGRRMPQCGPLFARHWLANGEETRRATACVDALQTASNGAMLDNVRANPQACACLQVRRDCQ